MAQSLTGLATAAGCDPTLAQKCAHARVVVGLVAVQFGRSTPDR